MPEEGVPLLPKSHIMSNEEIVGIAQRFVDLGVTKIRLTGGEPLMRKGLDNILAGLQATGATLSMTTNAILLDKHWETLQRYGVNNLNISLDSLQRDKMNALSRRNKFEVIMRNIDLAIEKGFNVKINVVLLKDVNDNEIADFVAWGMHQPISIRFIEFMPFNGNNWNWKTDGISLVHVLEAVKERFGEDAVERVADAQNDTTKNYKIKGATGTFGVISTVSNPFCDTCNRIRLTADGKMKNCLFSNNETDILTPFRNGEDIAPVIQQGIWHKHAERAGMTSFNDFADPKKNQDNRSMIRIGG
jgi:cyclic pyranopterin phosphate synthase